MVYMRILCIFLCGLFCFASLKADAYQNEEFDSLELNGSVFTYGSEPRINAEVTIAYLASSVQYTAYTDREGRFTLDLAKSGGFVVQVETREGEVGSAYYEDFNSAHDLTIYVEALGGTSVFGQVYVDGLIPDESLVVFAKNPKLSRVYATITEPDGSFSFESLTVDGDLELSVFGNQPLLKQHTSIIRGSWETQLNFNLYSVEVLLSPNSY